MQRRQILKWEASNSLKRIASFTEPEAAASCRPGPVLRGVRCQDLTRRPNAGEIPTQVHAEGGLGEADPLLCLEVGTPFVVL
jgi:hypothetical protein